MCQPLLGMLIKPFADVFAAKKPYSESAKPLLHRSFSDSEISSIETGVIKPFRRLDRKSANARPEERQRRSSIDHGTPLGMEVREVAITTPKQTSSATADDQESKPTAAAAQTTAVRSEEQVASPQSTPATNVAAAAAPASPVTQTAVVEEEPESAFQPPVIIVDETEELACVAPTISATMADPNGEGSDVEVILVLPDLSDEEAPPMVVLERTWDSSASVGSASDSELAEDEVRERLPGNRPPPTTMASYMESTTFSGNTLQVPQAHRRRNSHSFCDETVTTLFTTHKHPKERFRM